MATPLYDDFGSTSDAMKGQTTKTVLTNADSYVKPNVLNKYASYTYLFTLSGLSNSEIENPHSIVTGRPHDVVARSGGIGQDGNFSDFKSQEFRFSKGTNEAVKAEKFSRIEQVIPDAKNSDKILKRSHDIFFERVNITAVPRPNEERKLMNFTKIEMELSEPLGVTLFEKLRACAFNNGFIDHNDAPFLLTLEFRGYDSNGKMLGNVISKRHLPIVITNAEMDVSQAGTRYTLTAVPWTEFGMSNRFLYARCHGTVRGLTLDSVLNAFTDALNQAQAKEIEAQLRDLKDEYVITMDSLFAGAGITTEGMETESLGYRGDNITITWRDNMSIAKIITDAVLGLDLFRNIDITIEKYWTDLEVALNRGDDPTAKAPDPMIPWFKILTTIYTEKDFDQKTKMHKKVIRYHIEPYFVHVLNFSVPGLGGSEQWGKSVKKSYEYIFSGRNTEIIDLKLNYKYAYFQARLLDTTRSQPDTQPASKQDEKTKRDRLVKRYYGQGIYPDVLSLRGSPVGLKSADPSTQDRATRSNADEFFDYLTSPRGDMMKVDMTIMGDPAFIGQDMFLPMSRNFSKGNTTANNGRIQTAKFGDTATINSVGTIKGVEWDDDRGCFNFDRSEPLVSLYFRFPTDINEKQGLMDFQNLENVEFSGLYKVTQVESIFDQGTFTQQLLLVRFNNQHGGTKPIFYEEDNSYKEAISSNSSDILNDIIKNVGGTFGLGAGD